MSRLLGVKLPAVRMWPDVVNAVADEFGLWFTDYEAMHLLWEYTGYPSFFNGDPVTVASTQLREHFIKVLSR